MNEAEANESVLRTNYVNAVNNADETIALPVGATWNDILLQIPNIRADNKKWASGIGFQTSETYAFIQGDGSTIVRNAFKVNSLDFKPSKIILIQNYSSTIGAFTIYDYNGFTISNIKAIIANPRSDGSAGQSYSIKEDGVSLYVNETSFSLPTHYTNNQNQIIWIAIE